MAKSSLDYDIIVRDLKNINKKETDVGGIDVLNRFPDDSQTVMMYIFPREYGLHNAFTSEVDRQVEAGPVRDYTYRDEEIAALMEKYMRKNENIPKPKRLGDNVVELVKKFQKRHHQCSYDAMVKYCSPQSVSLFSLYKMKLALTFDSFVIRKYLRIE